MMILTFNRGRVSGDLHVPSNREKSALAPHWKDCILPEDRKVFLWMEGMFCIREEMKFRACNNEKEKEEWRLRILEKRQEWLQFWLKNIYHQEKE